MSTHLLSFPDFEKPSPVAIDSSALTLRDSISHEERYGKTNSIKYASTRISKVEPYYSTGKRPYLPEFFALKLFRMYVLSFIPFTSYRKQQALKSMLENREIHDSLVRWKYFLA